MKNKSKMEVIELDVLKILAAALAGCNHVDVVSTETQEEALDLSFFIQKVADKKGWKYEKTNGWLASIAEISPIAAFNIVLREIAVYLDQKYEDHIEKSENIFIISNFDGRIHQVCKKHIKNYRNFAAFRTIEDAKFACNLMRDYLKDMFNAKGK